ncbi:MAG: AarF/ABC1/UbiB kinase family protein [Candidatus Woesearchaeota archaeon]
MSLFQEIKDVARFEQILNVLFKHEFGFFIDQLRLKNHLSLHKRLQAHKFSKKNTQPERMKAVLEDLGATFVKLGQLLSLRPDLIPKEYCEQFKTLQDSVKPFPGSIAKKIIEEELKKPIKDIFRDFEETPVASASVAQIHKARLKNGVKVAIKVQRPGIDATFRTDVDIMYHLAGLLQKKMQIKVMDPVEIIDEFKRYTEQELDFIHEAKNIDQFYKNFINIKNVKIPRVYWAYTNSKVMTMDYIDGIRLRDIDKYKKYNKKKIVKNIVDAVFKQIFEDGFFHADPHAGNILVLENDHISFIDFGIVGVLGDELKQHIANFSLAVMEGDLKEIAKSVYNLGFSKGECNLELLEEDIKEGLGEYYGASLEAINLSEVLHNVLAIARKNSLKLPKNFVLLIKSLVTIEGVAAELDSSFNIVESVRPLIKRSISQKLSTKNLTKQAAILSNEYYGMIKSLPKNLISLIKTISGGTLKIEMDDTDINKLTLELGRSSNRMSYGMIIAASLIASSIVLYIDKGPKYIDVPIIALIGYALAGLFSLFLMASIVKEGKLRF